MPFTKGNAAEYGRQGGRRTAALHGTEHMRAIGRKGFAALARRKGFAGGGRLEALRMLLRRGKLIDRGPDPTAVLRWADQVLDNLDQVLDNLDPHNPEIPY